MADLLCPSEHELLPLLADESRCAPVREHVAGCPSCRQRLQRLQAEVANLRQALAWAPPSGCFSPIAGGENQVCPDAAAATVLVGRGLQTPLQEPGEGNRELGPPAAESWPQVKGYEILEELGRGGMGVVYKARQVGLNRLVALKMILQGAHAGAEQLARFRREAEAIARMQHPHIVQIHDIGEQDGRPFFSMELVAGGSLANHLDGTPLNARGAAGLVETLARAVHAAHEQGIIHRDLKPANILLISESKVLSAEGKETKGSSDSPATPYSVLGNCFPKISDFGLAKHMANPVASTSDTRHADRTPSGAILGTPSYMAPEQAQAEPAPVGPATDIYGLGAILYELLSGRPPFKAATPLETIMQVLHEEPVPPHRLQTKLPRDLETICLKCLQKEVRKRYATALELAEDLHLFQAGRPILARPVGHLGRAWRWSRRNPVVAGLLAVVALLLVSGTVVSSYFAVQAVQAAKEAEGDRDKALAAERAAKESEADTEAFSKFLVDDVLAVARPEGQAGGLGIDVTVRQALKAAAPKVGETFAGRPRAEARTRFALGETNLYLGETEAAIRELERARELYRQEYGPEATKTLRSMNDLALAYERAGRLKDALPLFEQTLQLQTAQLGPDHADTLTTMNNLALAYQAAGRLDDALPLLERTLQLRKAKLGSDHPETLLSMNSLAAGYRASGRLADALSLQEQAHQLQKVKLRPDHPEALAIMNNLASLYEAVGQVDSALPLYEQTFQLIKAKLGPGHPDTLKAMNNLAGGYLAAGRLADALPLFEQTLQLRKAKLGSDHPDTFISRDNLATAYLRAGQLPEALRLCEETLQQTMAKLGPDHPQTLTTMNNLARAYHDTGKLAEALKLYRDALQLKKAKLGPDHPGTLSIMNNLAGAYQDAGRLAEAVPLFEETLQLVKAKLRPDHPLTLTTMNNLARAYQDAGRLAEAVPLYEETLQRSKAKLGPDHPETLTTMNNLARTYQAAGRLAEAVALFEETLPLMKAKLGPDHPSTLAGMSNLALAYRAAERRTEALPLLEETFQRMKARLGPDHTYTLVCMNNLAGEYEFTGRLAEALLLFEETLRRMKAKLGPDHPHTLNTMNNLGSSYEAAGRLAEALPLIKETLKLRQARLGNDHPSTLTSMNSLASAYEVAGRLAEALLLFEETLKLRKLKLGPEHPEVAGTLANLGRCFLKEKGYVEAEPKLRESARIYERKMPDSWLRYNALSLLGESMLGQKKYAEAEPLLLSGYEEMKRREGKIPSQLKKNLTDALERLVQLYDAWGNKDKAEEWRKKLPMKEGRE